MNINMGQFNMGNEILIACSEHPGCVGCPYFTETPINGVFCETAIFRIRNGETNNEN